MGAGDRPSIFLDNRTTKLYNCLADMYKDVLPGTFLSDDQLEYYNSQARYASKTRVDRQLTASDRRKVEALRTGFEADDFWEMSGTHPLRIGGNVHQAPTAKQQVLDDHRLPKTHGDFISEKDLQELLIKGFKEDEIGANESMNEHYREVKSRSNHKFEGTHILLEASKLNGHGLSDKHMLQLEQKQVELARKALENGQEESALRHKRNGLAIAEVRESLPHYFYGANAGIAEFYQPIPLPSPARDLATELNERNNHYPMSYITYKPSVDNKVNKTSLFKNTLSKLLSKLPFIRPHA